MGSANVDLVRSIFAGWERGDYSSADWAHPEIEYVVADGPDPGSWTGLAGLAAAAREHIWPWADVRLEAEEYRELDDERVLVSHVATGRAKRSGLELPPARGAHLFHVRDGRATKLVLYFDRDRALADLGLARETGSMGP